LALALALLFPDCDSDSLDMHGLQDGLSYIIRAPASMHLMVINHLLVSGVLSEKWRVQASQASNMKGAAYGYLIQATPYLSSVWAWMNFCPI
jgi:hypothetical protein